MHEAESITLAMSQFAAGTRTKNTRKMSITALENEWPRFGCIMQIQANKEYKMHE
jgi:hypothetical protein